MGEPTTMVEPGKLFGQRRPPLSVTIKQILERYPDGQIFKEMIQNADDAGATVVQFYVDCRHHGTSGLVKPELKAYQGHALISANDAMFSKQDWEGIQSLQQSIKAEDPFKVGRFGIGFNSVYHLTDVPSIVSGDRLAFLEPQERVWEGQSGRWFSLQELSGSDHLNCLNGISNFNSCSGAQYNKTLFRFPLRSATSTLSDNVYTLQKVNELIDALRSEAKLLLLFLRSVHTIEVYNIDRYGNHTLIFQAKIADSFVAVVKQKRATLLRELKSCHTSNGYNFSSVLKFTSKFDVSVYDANTRHTSISHWLVANQVGSSSPTVRAAAVKQKVFPWVGTAVELDSPGNGRIFCFLPMPIETASNLPVHVNGTFGLNDDRRSLKWPGVERRNDPMADWNKMLVTAVIPSCYVDLLLEYKRFVSGKADFYTSWPNVSSLSFNTQWASLMSPVFSSILSQGVIWCESPVGMEWVTPGTAVYIPRSGSLPDVVKNALTTCGVKLAQVPANVWDACSHAGVPMIQVTPKYMRDKLRAYPHSYASCVGQDKKELLKYCMSDGQYSNLVNLQLLPMSNNSFTTFQNYYGSAVYMCTPEFPKWLLPNLDHKLVCLNDDPDLNSGLVLVGQSNCTQLRLLSVAHVTTLLDEVMYRWTNNKVISFPNSCIPSDWFGKFWNWVGNKQLQSFQNKLVLPVQRAHNVPATREYQVIRLAASQPVLYFPSHSAAGSNTMLSVLDKLGVQYCTQTSFPYVQHSQLTSYIKEYSPSALLDVMALKGSYASVSFTSQEADLLRHLFCQVRLMYQNEKTILQNLKIFSSCINSSNGLYSISQMYQISLLKQVVVQPSTTIDLSVLPSNVIILSSSDYYQNQLLLKLGHGATNGVKFLTQHIFPKLPSMGDHYIDPIMTRVLDIYPTLRYSNSAITSGIQYLQFVKVASGARKCPSDLYDPSNASLSQIFTGQGVFPCTPYDVSKYIATLRLCGLRTSVEPQAILDLIYTLSLQASSYPQAVDAIKMLRVRAIIEYASSTSFSALGSYSVSKLQKGYIPFSTALTLLSTHRSWLPVLVERPSNYPGNLPWKGSGYTSHLISLQGSVCASNSSSTNLPLLYGSQVYFTETFDSITAEEPKGCLVAHFQEVIARKDSLAPNEMLNMIRQIYYAMAKMTQSTDVQHLKPLKAMKEWVYIKKYHKFVSIDAVALKQNPGFHHNVEPYLHILPDSISGYSQLFKAFGMNDTISESQIVSILAIIRKEVGANQCSVSSEEAWSTALAILNWLTENGTKEVNNEAVYYVPAECDSQWPDMREPRELVYTDNEFLKTVVSSDNDERLTYVHDRINQSLAKGLLITPLSEELDISEDTFEDAGQHEPLIVRLKNILRDYKDGLTIVKELIQNADDAEATEVDICFDSRQHTSERNRLFFPDMCESHGPALVIHNNSQFSNEDFANIQKLAGCAKQGKHLKIGKFGIGFCSVYHITDVPSFVSRERLYIFDPTLNHLRKAVKNPSQPGKKVNYMTKFIQKSKQMEPYEGLFGFKKATAYNGTMFRLPFRTNASELSSTCYSQSTFTELLTSIQESGDKLLLFLQNVQRITVQQFDAGMTAPKVLYELRRHVPQPSLPLDNASIVTLESKSAGKSSKVPMSWLVASYSTTYDKKPALANVACSLNTSHSYDSLYSVNSDLTGEMFCFLPLSQATGLPVHVSCNFAVINNRRGIWTSAQEGTSIFGPEVQWNVFLMKNVIPVAYSKLLSNLKTLFERGSLQKYSFCSLWPLTLNLVQRNPWEKCVKMMYISLVQAKLFYSKSTCQWLSMRESKFLDPDILGQPGFLPCVLDVIHHLNLPLVDLPSSYKAHLNLTHESLTEKEFAMLFFTNLSQLTSIRDSRNNVIIYMLEAYATQYNDKLESELICLLNKKFSSHAFIPAAPYGSVLRKCTDIVSPEATFASLFDESENRFPLKILADRHLVMTALKQAGMMENTLNWDLIIDRAQSVKALMGKDRLKALERVKFMLRTLFSSVDGKSPTSGTTIDTVEFLPVQTKPKDYPLPWHGDNYQLLSGKRLVWCDQFSHPHSKHFERIAGSQVSFLCEDLPKHGGCGYVSYKTRELLQLRSSPSIVEVISHLKAVINYFDSSGLPQLDWITASCREIYQFIETALHNNSEVNLDELRGIAWIWNEQKFLSVECVALNWKLNNGPYLYAVPPSISLNKKLTSSLGIKEKFTGQDALKALEKMKMDLSNQQIDENVLTEMVSIFQKEQDLKSLRGVIYLPDTRNILHKSSELVFNDAAWIPLDKSNIEVNRKLFPGPLAVSLGVQVVRSKILQQYDQKRFRGVPFGQHEELTTKIHNIIKRYPFDITLLKELLQNADDAKATKMYVILDRRTHGKSSVISEEWQKLQGPALLVWNDSVFTEEDLEGIQHLGLGSKSDEAGSIGQFGIGFNVVYHLTDCPSFITNGDTLCVLDPHCRYVLEAEDNLPGARYDNLKNGFWKQFTDMSSAYLQDGVHELPDEILGGSLFRFPIRCTNEMVKSSRIINHPKKSEQPSNDFDHELGEKASKLLTSDDLAMKINNWMPRVKQALFFLRHVTEIKYIEIEEAGLHMKFHFKTDVKKTESIVTLERAISDFTVSSKSKSCVIQYPLTVTDYICVAGKTKREEWLIQQGIGNINNEGQYWEHIEMVKPIHGIAAPLLPQKLHDDSGQLFNFLPLPQKSGVPVHINGCFILDPSRRAIWTNTDPETNENDSSSQWNQCLFTAIASSYANFLVNAKESYLKTTYNDWTLAVNDLKRYYRLFPQFPTADVHKKWTQLPCEVYKALVQLNAEVLCVFVSNKVRENTKLKISVQWHPLKAQSKADQVYFWTTFLGSESKIILPILQSIGMNITLAPVHKMECLNKVLQKLASVSEEGEVKATGGGNVQCEKVDEPYVTIHSVSPLSVFKYYTECSVFSAANVMSPCPIKETVFRNATTFLHFTEYLLNIELYLTDSVSQSPVASRVTNLPNMKEASSANAVVCHDNVATNSVRYHNFPSSPFSHYLLLSADEILRSFDKQRKILNSGQCDLFPDHLEMFLHPALRAIKFNHSYFISSEDNANENTQNRVLDMFEGTLPAVMHDVEVVDNAPTVIDRKKLSNYWNCFHGDEVLASFIPKVLTHWALILSTDNRLFSTSSPILPAYYPSDPNDLTKDILGIMQALKMPFLDDEIVVAPVNCPKLEDHCRILSNFYHANKKVSLHQTPVVESTANVDALIQFFSEGARPGDAKWIEQISSLPLFVDVVGDYRPIFNKRAYIWPDNMCSSGYSGWSAFFNVTFVQSEAKWTLLGSPKLLSIKKITREQIYMDFIFNYFDTLQQEEQYSHLDYIKNCLHFTNEQFSKKDDESDETKQAKRFIGMLKTLKCLRVSPDDLKLLPISSFCDHTIEIFRTLSWKFQLLPENMKSEEWLKFFKSLELKTTLDKNEYLELCKEVAQGNVNNAARISNVLLKYLFFESDKLWFCNTFLSEVSDIPFVYTVDTSSVDWIAPGFCPAIKPVKLRGAASEHLMKCLWTVRPLISLPDRDLVLKSSMVLVKGLGIVREANVSDVVTNVHNICEASLYVNGSLFSNYPEELLPPGSLTVLDILLDNLKSLNRHVKDHGTKFLAKIPCVPVYCDLLAEDTRKIVLVKPSCVIMSTNSLEKYHPFLCNLPSKLSCLSELLAEIGVRHNLELQHIQIVLEKVFVHCHGKQIEDSNLLRYVKNAITDLRTILSPGSAELTSSSVPLYLPDATNTLKDSTTLLYGDTPSFKGQMEIDLTPTSYSYFDIKLSSYGVSAYVLCQLLPMQIRPKGMSEVCTQVPNSGCESVQHSEFSHQVIRCLQSESNGPAIVQFFKSNFATEESEDTLTEVIVAFLSSLEVVTKHDLRMQIWLKKPDTLIGQKKSNYYLDSSTSQLVLYIDDDFEDGDKLFAEVSWKLLAAISKFTLKKLLPDFKEELSQFIKDYLKAPTERRKQKILAEHGLEQNAGRFTIALGEYIPRTYRHHLDLWTDKCNIFRPMEYVGYEEKENHIIVAQIVYLVEPESLGQLTATYHIFISNQDQGGRNVSILDLYKLVPSSGSIISCDLTETQENICKELKRIWKLDGVLRNKALRRLYLKCQNLDDTERAKEVAQFLKSETNRLYIEEAKATETDHASPNSGSQEEGRGSMRSCNFHNWDIIARQDHNVGKLTFEQVKEQKRPEEGRRWVKQAETDYKVLCDIHSKASTSKGYGHVCFMAHQVVEKALKGGVYALCGMDGRGLTDHNLTRHAYALRTVEPEQTQELHLHISPLESYYLDTRYPNCWPGCMDTPSDRYDSEDADKAKDHAKAVLNTVIYIMP